MRTDCAECGLLWRTYARAKTELARLERTLRAAIRVGDPAAIARLFLDVEGAHRTAAILWREIRKHESKAHGRKGPPSGQRTQKVRGHAA